MKGSIKPVVVLFVICALVSAALSGTYRLTREKIAEAAKRAITEKIAELVPETVGTELTEKENLSYYELTDAAGASLGRAYLVTASGYGGELKVMVAVKETNTVVGIRILSSSETPGLGKRAEEESFYGQYAGIQTNAFTVVKTGKVNPNEIAAISSATITSKAVTRAVNIALADYTGKEMPEK